MTTNHHHHRGGPMMMMMSSYRSNSFNGINTNDLRRERHNNHDDCEFADAVPALDCSMRGGDYNYNPYDDDNNDNNNDNNVHVHHEQQQVIMEDVFLDDEGSVTGNKSKNKYRPSTSVSFLLLGLAGILILLVTIASVFGGTNHHHHHHEEKESSSVSSPTTLITTPPNNNNNNDENTAAAANKEIFGQGIAPIGMTTYSRDPQEYVDIIHTLENQLGSTYFEDSVHIMGFQYQVRQTALSYLLYEDPIQLTASNDNDNDNNLLQRYIMILFYYHTTRYHPWEECNPPSTTNKNDENEKDTATTATSSTNTDLLCYHPTNSMFATEGHATIWGHQWLTKHHECNWAGVLCDKETKTVIDIDLDVNKLNGPIPWELTALTGLVGLSLRSNDLTGTIPVELADLNQLNELSLGRNQLKGTIPSEIFSRRRRRGGSPPAADDVVPLMYLSLGSNRLTGTIPTQVGLMKGTYLHLSNNDLTGTIPLEFFHANFTNFWLEGNFRLTGTLPTEIGLLSNARWIDLSYTGLTGSLPTEIGLLSTVREFNMTSTRLGGTIPEEFYRGLKELGYLDLGDCQFSGTISTYVGLLQDLRWFHIRHNNFEGTLPTEMTTLTKLKQLELQGNYLSGSIPQAICSLKDEIGGWGDFELIADCMPEEDEDAAIDCPQNCCTTCCSPKTGICRQI